ncbi:MAG: ATP-binding protein [Symploca sp. SIO1B1]|nr:ATP-binding protein [Symploca sp. SIO1B1]
MEVIYIGDRAAGKTHLAMELANPDNDYVRVSSPEYEYLKSLLYDETGKGTKATDANKEVDERFLDIEVRLPSGYEEISLDWVDTPGEIWRKKWRRDNADKWRNFVQTAQKSEGILLIIAPYRNLIREGVDVREFITKQQWCRRFELWVKFFQKECPQAKRLLICLNKADLFCDLKQEAARLERLKWQQKHTYILQKYFKPIQSKIEKINENNYGLAINCFITSIYNRQLLELPWRYLGSYLADYN